MHHVDSLQNKAITELKEFSQERHLGLAQGGQTGWTMVKEYKKPGTLFEFWKDPIASDSIAVCKRFRHILHPKKGEPNERYEGAAYVWISNQKDLRGIPFVYQIWDDDAIDFVQRRAKDQEWRDRIHPFYLETASDPHFDLNGSLEYYLNTLWPPAEDGKNYGRNEIEVWKRGTTAKQRKQDPLEQTSAPKHSLQPQPVTV